MIVRLLPMSHKGGGFGILTSLKVRINKSYMKHALKKEKVFKESECDVKYLLMENNSSDKLVIVFSGFPPENETARYNYVLKLRDIKCNKLFILDDAGSDPRGTYYLGENKDFFIERSVKALIDKVSRDLNIAKEDIVTFGSSKGGYASLYYSFKYGYGTAIAGAPQVLLGDYLSFHARRNIMKYISGNDTADDIKFLNELLLDVIKRSEKSPDVYLHVSKNEHHYKDHVIHLTELLDKRKIQYDLDLESYKTHGEVGRFLAPYARSVIQKKILEREN